MTLAEDFGFDKPPGYFRAGEGGCTCWPPHRPDYHDRPNRLAGPRGAHDEACAVYRAWQAELAQRAQTTPDEVWRWPFTIAAYFAQHAWWWLERRLRREAR